MKKFNLLFLCSLFIISLQAQVGPIDYEESGHGGDWTWTVFENDTNPALEIVDNPDPTGANTSNTVAKFTALQAGMPFAGCETLHNVDIGSFTIGSSNNTISIMVWKTVISDVGIKLVKADSWSLGEIKIANTVVNEWEKITFDFSDHEGIEYDQLVIFPDFDERDADNIIYFDNISFSPVVPLPEPMEPAPDPTIDPANVISMFSNVYTDVAVDTWLTPWSNGNLEEIQIMGNDTKKYEDLNFVGIETTGANLIDASSMEYFHIDVWTPNMTTFRVKLVDFGADGEFDGGDDSEHELIFDNHPQNTWVTYQLPLSDFTNLASTTNLAQLVLSCLPVGAGTVYVDNVYFSNLPTSTVNLATNNLKLFPNPSYETVQIQAEENITDIKVYDQLGKLVIQKSSSSNTINLNIAHLPDGLYTALVTVGDELLSKKFMKVK